MNAKLLSIPLGLSALASGCGREIIYLRGCEERLAMPYKRMECRACVERPMPHKYLPDERDGTRCVRR